MLGSAPPQRGAPTGATPGGPLGPRTDVPRGGSSTPGCPPQLDLHQGTDRAPARWRSHCDKCRAFIPQGVNAALCDAPRCPYILCLTCFPNTDEELWCPAHAGGVRLSTQRGEIAVAPAVQPQPAPPVPLGASPVLALLFTAIVVILAATAPSAVPHLERSWRFFLTFLRFLNIGLGDVTEWIVCAYVLCRVCPPVGVDLPGFMARRVMPATANGDIQALRRRARMSGMPDLLAALNGEKVMELIRRLTAGVKRRKTNKAPILIHHIRTLWQSATAKSVAFVRDVTLLLVGLLAGLRRREIVALCVGDVLWNGRDLRVTIRRDKVNFNLIGAECPRTVVVAHALLDEVWPRFAATFIPAGTPAGRPLFRRCVGVTITADGIAPDTVRTIIRERLPGLPVSPHSLRVGCATELHAAGVSVEQIMEIGRWTSLAALLYVLPSADAMARATRAMGNGGVRLDRVLVQRETRTDPSAPRVRRLA